MLRDDSTLSRNEVMERLYSYGIPTRRGVMASHLEPPYAGKGVDLPVTEYVFERALQLPMHSELKPDEAERVVAALNRLCG